MGTVDVALDGSRRANTYVGGVVVAGGHTVVNEEAVAELTKAAQRVLDEVAEKGLTTETLDYVSIRTTEGGD